MHAIIANLAGHYNVARNDLFQHEKIKSFEPSRTRGTQRQQQKKAKAVSNIEEASAKVVRQQGITFDLKSGGRLESFGVVDTAPRILLNGRNASKGRSMHFSCLNAEDIVYGKEEPEESRGEKL